MLQCDNTCYRLPMSDVSCSNQGIAALIEARMSDELVILPKACGGSNVLKGNYKDKQAGEAAAVEAVAAALGGGHPRVMHNPLGYCTLTFETSAAAAAAQVTLSKRAFFSSVNAKQVASGSGELQAQPAAGTGASGTGAGGGSLLETLPT